jgi:hypothetical protein
VSAAGASPSPSPLGAGDHLRAPRRTGARSRMRTVPGWLLLAGAVLAVFLVLGLLGEALGGGPQGPVSSSYATNATGVAAWSELLRRSGHPVVQLRSSLERARLDPQSTVVLLDPDALLRSEALRLLAFVRGGGRLLAAEPRLAALLPGAPNWDPHAVATRERPPSGGGHTLPGVGEVASASEGEWRGSGSYEAPLRSSAGGALLLVRPLGRGRLELLADASPLQNRLLAVADNAQLGAQLVGGGARRVVFVESVHGFGEARGLAALPARWRLAIAGLALAGLLWIVARGRRLGPPERTLAEPPRRGAYVDALALILRRSGSPQELAAELTRLRDKR